MFAASRSVEYEERRQKFDKYNFSRYANSTGALAHPTDI